MKNTLLISIIALLVLNFSSCSDDMTSNQRIINNNELKNIKKIAFINFAINSHCSIGTGEDAGSVNNKELIKNWGKYHLSLIYDNVETRKSPIFLDLNKMIKSTNYQNFKLTNYYDANASNWKSKIPRWIYHGKYFMNTYNGTGVVLVNSENAKKFCQSLNVDAVLGMEVTYSLNESFNIPLLGNFIKPNWTTSCNIVSKIFNSKGELVWNYEFTVDSPLKLKANKSLNLILYSSSSITGKQTDQLFESVEKYSTTKIIDALYSDIDVVKL